MSEEQIFSQVEARLARLERQNRRLRIGIILVVLVAAGLAAVAWRIEIMRRAGITSTSI